MKRANTPPAPQPEAADAATPAPEPEPPATEPLSIPQTQVQLPRPQAIDPAALAAPPVPPAAEVAAQHQRHNTQHRASPVQAPPAPATAKADPSEPTETATAEPPRPRIEPVIPADERRRLQEDIASRLKQVDQLLQKILGRQLSKADNESVSQIKYLEQQSQQALEQGNIDKADKASSRAVILAQDLLGGKQ